MCCWYLVIVDLDKYQFILVKFMNYINLNLKLISVFVWTRNFESFIHLNSKLIVVSI